MTTSDTDLEGGIRLAIEAAAAANAVSGDVDRMRSEIADAAGRLDRARRILTPVLAGVAAGAALSVIGAGLLYFRTLADLEITRQMQIEALALLTEELGRVETAVEAVTAWTEARQNADATLEDRVAALVARLETPETDAASVDQGGTAGGISPQIGRSIIDSITAAHEATRSEILAATADLQLALSRMLAETPRAAPPAPDRPSAARSPTDARPAGRPRPAPPPNPFSYP